MTSVVIWTSTFERLYLSLAVGLDISDDQAIPIVTVSFDSALFGIGYVIHLWTLECLRKNKGFP